jgi:hypothetical protein
MSDNYTKSVYLLPDILRIVYTIRIMLWDNGFIESGHFYTVKPDNYYKQPLPDLSQFARLF